VLPTRLETVHGQPERATRDPLDGIDSLHDFQDAELLRRAGDHEATAGAATAGHDSLTDQLL